MTQKQEVSNENIDGVCKRGDWVYGALVSDLNHEAHPYCLR